MNFGGETKSDGRPSKKVFRNLPFFVKRKAACLWELFRDPMLSHIIFRDVISQIEEPADYDLVCRRPILQLIDEPGFSSLGRFASYLMQIWRNLGNFGRLLK